MLETKPKPLSNELFAFHRFSNASEQLPYASCCFPIVGKDLRWGKGLNTIGTFTDLEIGRQREMFSEREKLLYTIVHMAKYTI